MIAAFWGDHPRHQASLEIFAGADQMTGFCGAHSLAEVYAVMTSLPVRPSLPPDQVILFVEQIPARLGVIALDNGEYVSTIRELAGRGVSGGRIYDGLLLACARKSKAETIYTWNTRHFERLAPDLATRVRTP